MCALLVVFVPLKINIARSDRRVPLAVSVVGTVLLLAINASAAPAPYGAYLGCYNLNSMGLSSNERTVRSFVQSIFSI